MQNVARQSLEDPAIVSLAADIVAEVDGRDTLGQIAAIRSWLARYVRFLPDPRIDGDVIRTPAALLSQLGRVGYMQGDCDDVSTLAATLGQAVGLNARFVTLGFDPVGPYTHVFCELEDETGQWHELDVTEPDGVHQEFRPARREEYPATTDDPRALDLRGLLGILEIAYVAYGAWKGFQQLYAELLDGGL